MPRSRDCEIANEAIYLVATTTIERVVKTTIAAKVYVISLVFLLLLMMSTPVISCVKLHYPCNPCYGKVAATKKKLCAFNTIGFIRELACVDVFNPDDSTGVWHHENGPWMCGKTYWRIVEGPPFLDSITSKIWLC